MPPSNLNAVAKTFKALHKPGSPVVLANVYDTLTAQAVAALPSCKALATASYAVAQAAGTVDDDLSLEQNLAAGRAVGKVAAEHGKPLTIDMQDGYGSRLEEAVKGVIEAGAVGINLEDVDKETHKQYSVDKAAMRVKTALQVAEAEGVKDFVVNARCDTLVYGGVLDDVITRGKKYLEAGATSVFVWGGSKRGVRTEEVEQMVKAFDGRLNVSMRVAPGNLTVKELAKIGVSRISVGPTLQFVAMEAYKKGAEDILG